ncbi:MAG: 50S ribosomal protein L10 [Deltaproteobacteria bacterium]|nr:MAG: 50S ribosomal protein L10 [Deltaproteobacteria bacterium]
MNRTQKEQAVAELHSDFSAVQGAVLADYKGLSVKAFSEIRKSFRDKGITLKVVKNTLARIAAQDTPMEVIAKDFVGPTVIAYSLEETVTPAKVATECAKEQDLFVIRCGYADSTRLDISGVEQLAKMPGKEELQSKLLGTLLAPAQQLVQVLNAVPQQLAQVLSAYQDKIDGGGDSGE